MGAHYMYWSLAFVRAARKYFPKVMASNYRYRKWTMHLCIPESQYGVMVCNSGSGSVVGGDSNGYSTQNLYNNDANMAAADTLQHFFGVSDYLWEPMNQLRFAALTVRGMVLGGKSASGGVDVPVKPWGAPRFHSFIAVLIATLIRIAGLLCSWHAGLRVAVWR